MVSISSIPKRPRARLRKIATATLAGGLALTVLAACGSSSDSDDKSSAPESGTVTVELAKAAVATKPTSVEIKVSDELRAKLPKKVRDSGKLVVGGGFLPSGVPPLGYLGTDQKTWTGSEPDMSRMVAAVFGLKADFQPVTFQNLFVRLLAGQYDVAFSQVSITEARKDQGMDFASYRKDQAVFEVLKTSDWNWDGPESLAGKTVAVKPGTHLQEMLVEWQKEMKAAGKPFEIKYFTDVSGIYLALDSGRIDVYYTSTPAAAYHVQQTESGEHPTRLAGVADPGPGDIELLIGAATKKDNGLVEPISEAIDYLIQNGQYQKWIDTYGLQPEAVTESKINPPGLPGT